jgi:serine/threonine-protein kinase
VKVLHPELAEIEDIRARFTREGYVANKVDHRGAVTVLDDDVDDEDGSVFLVMELLEGETLEELIVRRGGTLPPDEILPRIKQLLDVLAAAHDKGVVHRDLKPENVFLEREGGGLKVLDFGIARLADGTGRTTTHTGQVIGTPAYMAPEQARGETTRVGPATDLWAVGAIMFRALTGRVVYDAKAPAMSVVLAGTKPPPKIAEVMPSLDPALAAVIDRTLDPVIEERWTSAAAMLAAIEKLEGNGPDTVSKTEVAPPANSTGENVPAPDLSNQRTVFADAVTNEPQTKTVATNPPPAAPTPSPPMAAAIPPAKKSSGNASIAIVAIGALVVGALAVGGIALVGLRSGKATTTGPSAVSSSAEAPVVTPVAPLVTAPTVTSSEPPTIAPSASASATVAEAPSAAASKEPRDDMPPPATKPRAMGAVSITTFPVAKVMLGSTVLCDRTPCTRPIAAGDHTLRLVGPAGGVKLVAVHVKAGETTAKIVSLK